MISVGSSYNRVRIGAKTEAGLARLEQKLPDLAPWILPHLVWDGFGLALVLWVALYFSRQRTELG